jgi:hypothetical protein
MLAARAVSGVAGRVRQVPTRTAIHFSLRREGEQSRLDPVPQVLQGAKLD